MVDHGSRRASCTKLDPLTKGLWNMDCALYIVLCLTASLVQSSAGRGLHAGDLEGLIAFKKAADRSGVLNHSWTDVTTSGPCGNASTSPWLGIVCNDKGRVSSVQLPGMQLTGSFEKRTLSKLSDLRYLNLANNSLSGFLPDDLANLEGLLQFAAQDNKFSGPFPILSEGVGIVDLSGNDLHGRLHSLSRLTSLTMLNLSANRFRGNISALPKNLQSLNLSANSLTGIIPPDLSNLADLTVLDLSRNQFHRSIPPLPENLVTINLSNNSLVGNIPSDLSALTKLVMLDLSANQLQGNISSDLSALTELAVLDLSANQLEGNIPALPTNVLSINLSGNSLLTGIIPPELIDLNNLTVLDLSGNSFHGDIPTLASSLQVLNISDNSMAGNIPTYLTGLINLKVLDLHHNQVQGNIPDLPSSLETLNLADNLLTGDVPTALAQRFPLASFAGNADLCGPPTTTPCPAPSPAPAPAPATSAEKPAASAEKPAKKLTSLQIGLIVAVGLYLGLIILILARYSVAARKKPAGKRPPVVFGGKKDSESSGMSSSFEKSKDVKFVIVDEDQHSFDLNDLLRASAEILGRDGIGTAYKAVLENGLLVVVKRFKDVRNTELKEFNHHMKMLGKLRHPNLVPLTAYCFTTDDKLLIYDYMPNGSLFSLLHGARGPGRKPLEWPSRLNIALKIAEGLTFLHRKCQSLNVPHGNLKSSNVLMGENFEVKIADFGLVPLVNSTPAAHRMAGYQAPECTKAKRITFKADVYSFGVLLLELLTGRQPAMSGEGEGIDLPKWVRSVTKEQWTGEVLDTELKTHHDEEDQMVSLLQIAMVCAMSRPEKRPDMAEVLEMIENIDKSTRPAESSVEFPEPFQSPEHSKHSRHEVASNDVMDILRGFWLPSSHDYGTA